MAVVCVGSVRGAPGVTTLAVVAATAWPRPVVLVEVDPHGGTLAVRHGLSRQPGLAALAAAVRAEPSSGALLACAQLMPGSQLPVVVAPEAGDIATRMIEDVEGHLGLWLAQVAELDVIVDCGRLAPRSPATGLLRAADLTLLVTRPRADELHTAAHRVVSLLRSVTERLGLVLVGDQPYGPRAVKEQLGLPVEGVVADDSRAAASIVGASIAGGARRSSLVRSVQTLVDGLADTLGIEATGERQRGGPPRVKQGTRLATALGGNRSRAGR